MMETIYQGLVYAAAAMSGMWPEGCPDRDDLAGMAVEEMAKELDDARYHLRKAGENLQRDVNRIFTSLEWCNYWEDPINPYTAKEAQDAMSRARMAERNLRHMFQLAFGMRLDDAVFVARGHGPNTFNAGGDPEWRAAMVPLLALAKVWRKADDDHRAAVEAEHEASFQAFAARGRKADAKAKARKQRKARVS